MRHRIYTGIIGVAAAALIAQGTWAAVGDKAAATLKDRSGKEVGTVDLEQMPGGTLVRARLRNLPEGAHAFHIHQTGKCEPPFDSAGGHFNSHGARHGFAGPEGPHAGDFPNLHIPASGALEIEYISTRLALDEALFDQDGAAVLIHEHADDYRTDPAGDAGGRIACGIIERRS